MKSNGMFASRFPIKPANPAIDRAAMTISVMAAFRICFFIVSSIRFLWQLCFRFTACVYWQRKASFSFASVDCLGLRIEQTLCQWPSAKSIRIGIISNYVSKDGLFLGLLSWEYRRAESAEALTLSDRIARLYDQLAF